MLGLEAVNGLRLRILAARKLQSLRPYCTARGRNAGPQVARARTESNNSKQVTMWQPCSSPVCKKLQGSTCSGSLGLVMDATDPSCLPPDGNSELANEWSTVVKTNSAAKQSTCCTIHARCMCLWLHR